MSIKSFRKTKKSISGRSNPTKKSISSSRTSTKKSKNIYQQIIYCFMHMLNTVKLYHWKTTSYSTHKATDQLFSDLNSKIDEFVEVMLGKPELAYNRNFILNIQNIKLQKYNNNTDFKKEIEYYKMFMIDLSQKKEFSHNNNNNNLNADLLAIRDEILALLNQFLYLLSLKD
jgi:hypothetical protein